jgi:hypothetical protein
VRPIVLGKAGVAVKFGAKVAISLENSFSRIEKLSWDAYNDVGTLIESVERYKDRHGYYPEAVLADRKCRNRKNLTFYKEHKIRLSGPKIGRPLANSLLKKAEKKIERLDAMVHNAVEGKFGEGKRKHGLDHISAKLKETAKCMIATQLLVMNLDHNSGLFLYKF